MDKYLNQEVYISDHQGGGGGLGFEGMFNWIIRVSRRIIHLNQQSTFEFSQHNMVICSHGSELK